MAMGHMMISSVQKSLILVSTLYITHWMHLHKCIHMDKVEVHQILRLYIMTCRRWPCMLLWREFSSKCVVLIFRKIKYSKEIFSMKTLIFMMLGWEVKEVKSITIYSQKTQFHHWSQERFLFYCLQKYGRGGGGCTVASVLPSTIRGKVNEKSTFGKVCWWRQLLVAWPQLW